MNVRPPRKKHQLLRDALTIIPEGCTVHLVGNPSLKKQRLSPRHKGKIGRVINRLKNSYTVVVSGSRPVGYKTLFLDRTEIMPYAKILGKDYSKKSRQVKL